VEPDRLQQAVDFRLIAALLRRENGTEVEGMNGMNTMSTAVFQGLNLRIADISITLMSGDSDLKLGVQGATEKFVVPKRKPGVRISARWGDLSAENHGEMLFDSGALWQLYRQNGSYHFRFTSPTFGSIPYKVARFDTNFASGEVILHRPFFDIDQTIYPLEYPLDELLVLNLLAGQEGIEVHGCGVVDDQGEGYLFLGQSGAGKSTMAKLWQKRKEVKILSDDRIILRKKKNDFLMYGTPWHGEAGLACSTKAPLKGVYFLKHGLKNELLPVKEAESAGRLFACSFPPFYSPGALNFVLSFFDQLVKKIACKELSFLPNESVLELIKME
jgi:hypothetical protein